MNRDRIVQLLALCLTLGCLVTAIALMPTINSQRRELQLSYDIEVGDRVDPRYAITAAAMGSFRGLAVDILWYRAEQLKQQGKHWEASTLAEWITTLQPRFPQVWSFHAWNMAYNISVQTHTPEERWNWVNKGVRLLREEGIPNNPTAIRLYRELGWIFFHKFGQYADDMHWYYKIELAREWQEVLGTPVPGMTGEDAVEVFRPVVEAADRYFQLDRPSYAMRAQLRTMAESLAETHPDEGDALLELSRRGLAHFMERAPRLAERLREQGLRQLAEELAGMLTAASERLERGRRDSLALLLADVPSIRPVLERLNELEMEPDEATLRRIGRLEMYLLYVSPQMLLEQGQELFGLGEAELHLLTLLMNQQNRQAVQALLPYLRARTLVQTYHMDPAFMMQLMKDFGPIDWRHPGSHGVYWSALGVDMIREVRDRTNIDLLNTNRQVIHGLQALMRTGRVTFDPLAGHFDTLPEPAFIPAYEKAVDDAEQRAVAMGLGSEGTIESFHGGHENFLITAIVYSYLYGEVDQARHYYDRVRELYGDKAHNQRDRRYQRTLGDFVMLELAQDGMQQHQARQFVDAMVMQGLSQGLAHGRVDVFNRFIDVARGAFNRYRAERDYANPNAPAQRLGLGTANTFEEAFRQTYIVFMSSPQTPLLERRRIYLNTPLPMLRETFPYFREPIYQQAQQQGLDPERAFPAPPEVDQREIRPTQQRGPETVERQ